jgi:restriction endonuclease S subunit
MLGSGSIENAEGGGLMDLPSYASYKDCEVEFFATIPSHWIVWKVTHGFELIGSGTTPKSSNPAFYDGDTPWITTSELRENIVHESKHMVSDQALKEYSTLKVYEPGALAIAMYGATIGRLGILGVPATVNQACCVFDKPEQFDIKFFFYWLWMHRPTLISLSVGGGQPNLSQDDLKQLRVPAPPIPEQTQIAKFLDYKTAQIDRLIEKKKALIEKLGEQRIAMITQAVTKGLNPDAPMKDSEVDWLGEVPEHWEVARLRFSIKSNPVKSEIDDIERDDMVSFVPMDAVGEYGGIRLCTNKILDDVYDGYTYFRNNDVVIAKITPCFENGKGALANNLTNGIAFGTTELHVMRPLNECSERWLFYLSISHAFREIGASEMYGAGGQKRVPESFIKNFRLGIPSFEEQETIADYLDTELKKMADMLAINDKTIERLNEYRTALITAAVTGKIDVRNVEVPEEY